MIQRPTFPFERTTTIPNAWVRDSRISRRARGLLAELMSHTPGWEVTIESLMEAGPEGRSALRGAIVELETAGYLTRHRRRDSGGRLGGTDYMLADPFAEETPTFGFPPLANQTFDNRPSIKKPIEIETHEQETHDKRAGRATDKQLAYLHDLYEARGGWVSAELEGEWSDMNIQQADALIQEYKALAPPPWRQKQVGGF
jgi:hypothetical protein